MAEFIPSKKWSELASLTVEQIAQRPCVEVTDDNGNMLGELGVFLMVPKTDFLRNVMDTRGQLSNAFYVEPVTEAPLYVSPKPSLPGKKRKKGKKKYAVRV